MTGAKCAANCIGFKYFGTQYSAECFCGNDLPTVSAPESECASPCSGDDSELCGGAMRFSVYGPVSEPSTTPTLSVHSSTPVPIPTAIADFAYEGCYTDIGPVRALGGKVTSEIAMTLEKCAVTCSAYTYFGLEYGNECYCGLILDVASEKKPEEECNTPCAGNELQKCGAGYRLNLYKKPELDVPPSNLETVGAFRYKSCWTDKIDDRSLTEKTYASDDMTVNSCAAFCQGSTYFGVEWFAQCFCGNEIGGEAAPESECNVLCLGDNSQFCGDANRLNVYTTNAPVTSLTSSSSTQSSEISSSTNTLAPVTSSTTATSSITTTTSEAPSMTTVTSCPAAPTYNGTPEKCSVALPYYCEELKNNIYSFQDCRDDLGPYSDWSDSVKACMPEYDYPPWGTPSITYYNCLKAAGILCNFDSLCTTATYTVGQVPNPTPTIYRNVIATNAGFDAGDTSGWTKDINLNQFTESFVDGLNSPLSYKASYKNTNGGNLYMTQDVVVVPGAQYKMSISVKQDNANGYCGVEFFFYPFAADWSSSSISVDLRGREGNKWITAESTFTTPRSYGYIGLSAYCNMQSVNALYSDNLSLTRV